MEFLASFHRVSEDDCSEWSGKGKSHKWKPGKMGINFNGKKMLKYPLLQTELSPTPNLYTEALTPHVTIFGDRACREVIRVGP